MTTPKVAHYDPWADLLTHARRAGTIDLFEEILVALREDAQTNATLRADPPSALLWERGAGLHRYRLRLWWDVRRPVGEVLCSLIEWHYPTPGAGYSSDRASRFERRATPAQLLTQLRRWFAEQDRWGRPPLSWERDRAGGSHAQG